MNSFSIPIANKFSMLLIFFLFTIVMNLWHQKFITADVIAVFVNKQHVIHRRKQDFDKKFVYIEVHQQSGWQTNFRKKAGQNKC